MNGTDDLKLQIEQALQSRDMPTAERLLSRQLERSPGDSDSDIALALVQAHLRRNLEAIALLREASARHPHSADLRAALFDALIKEQMSADALQLIDGMPAIESSTLRMRWHRADLLGKVGRHAEQIEAYSKLAAEFPSEGELGLALAYAYKTVGRTDEAVTTLRRLLDSNVAVGRAWWLLSDLKSFRFDDADRARMLDTLAAGPTVEEAIPIHFALGKAFGDSGDFAQAFEHYRKGNQLEADRSGQTWEAVEAVTDRAIATYSAAFLKERSGSGHDSKAPIFVIGLHRSGSTLIEQILASHSAIEGAGELPILPQVAREILANPAYGGGDVITRIGKVPADDFKAFGQLYLDRVAKHRRTDRPFFVDKLPSNWRRLGLIRLFLPNAKIIDARRHPMAVGWSNYVQNFGHSGPSTRDLGTFGRFYRSYLKLVSHFETIAPGAIHRVVNERLIEDFEGEVRAMLDYLGLPFEQQCLEFYRTERAVPTPSAEQVRQPINRAGVARWKDYEPWLGEMKAALGPALDGWDLPAGSYADE